MQEQVIRFRMLGKVGIHLIVLERSLPRFLLLFKSHAGPYVGVNDIRILHRFFRTAKHFDLGSGRFCDLLGLCDHLLVRLIAFGTCNRDMNPQLRTADHQGMSHVIAVANISKLQSFKSSLMLKHRLEIRKHLTWMGQIAQTVNDRHRRVPGQIHHVVVAECTNHDPVQITGHDLGRIADRLAASKLDIVLAQEEGVTAQLICTHLERDPGSG
ncbi:hypothetical protein D3C86_525110 [compost metagenome]